MRRKSAFSSFLLFYPALAWQRGGETKGEKREEKNTALLIISNSEEKSRKKKERKKGSPQSLFPSAFTPGKGGVQEKRGNRPSESSVADRGKRRRQGKKEGRERRTSLWPALPC